MYYGPKQIGNANKLLYRYLHMSLIPLPFSSVSAPLFQGKIDKQCIISPYLNLFLFEIYINDQKEDKQSVN